MHDLEVALKSFERNKSRDPLGFANETFLEGVAGINFKTAILRLLNKIKTEQVFPRALEKCNISSIWKKKGSRHQFDDYRGIFRVTILRSILDRLIYNDEFQNIDKNLTDANVGARKGRNIRDNIFVLSAITNSVQSKKQSAVDVQVLDVEKCFDSLWLHECINDLYDAGFVSDKLPLIFMENQNAQVAIKTGDKLSNRVSMKNIVMQGSVWGSTMCTTLMDKLGKLAYQNEDMLYRYRGKVAVPPLLMVDNILSIQKCTNTIRVNAAINSFIETKKLNLGLKKCSRIHIGKTKTSCHQLYVHESLMNESSREKYLGDIIDKSGNIKATIQDRKNRAYAIISEMKAILTEIPLGKHRLEIGLQLRQAMFINGILFNSEAWHGVTKNDIEALEKLDQILLRFLLGSHAKTPVEMLYLESGTMPLSFIISTRRVIYLQTLLKRNDNEVTKQVLLSQIEDPYKGDFIQLVEDDLKAISFPVNYELVKKSPAIEFKNLIKKKFKTAAFEHLVKLKQNHSKVRQINHSELKTQEYLLSHVFSNKDAEMIFSLRTKINKQFSIHESEEYELSTSLL